MNTSNVNAREKAYDAIKTLSVDPTSLVVYSADNSVLLLCDSDQVADIALSQLKADFRAEAVIITDSTTEGERKQVLPHYTQAELQLKGFLGEFSLQGRADGKELASADIVVDMLAVPLLTSFKKPPGYLCGSCPDGIDIEMLDTLGDLVGEFEKPRYYEYNADLCAHGRSGITACTRCLDVCPAEAITSLGELISVSEELCHGVGACATACPTGAISYNFPAAIFSRQRLKRLLGTYYDNAGQNAQLLLLDESTEAELQLSSDGEWLLPGAILPVVMEEQGSLGMDSWLSALCYGAKSVSLLCDRSMSPGVMDELDAQIGVANVLLKTMGYGESLINRIQPSDITADGLNVPEQMPDIACATFDGTQSKRNTIVMALDYLADNCRAELPERSDLPEASLFGRVDVKTRDCTLCMSCVSVCPASALSDGGEVPRLNFFPVNCVQCGLCEQACPENAISLVPEFIFDREIRRKQTVLNEEKPFHCISCDTPFATSSMISRILGQLSGHSMFQSEKELNRLKMCADCRVVDLLREEQGHA